MITAEQRTAILAAINALTDAERELNRAPADFDAAWARSAEARTACVDLVYALSVDCPIPAK